MTLTEESMKSITDKSIRENIESAVEKSVGVKKSTKTKRQLRGSAEIHSTNLDSVKAMMPYA